MYIEMTLLKKIIAESLKHNELLSQAAEQSYRAFTGARPKRANFTEGNLNEKKHQMYQVVFTLIQVLIILINLHQQD